MPYIFVTVQSGGWDPSLPINLDYSPELDPEIHSFLREQEQQQHHVSHRDVPKKQEAKGMVATHCELRLILDGLEKLGFQLVTTTSYSFQGRSHNEFIMHRELAPVMDDEHGFSKQTPNKTKKNNNKHHQRDHSNSSNHSIGDDSKRAPESRVNKNRYRPPSPSHNIPGKQTQRNLYY
ncbi:uncharacterized protein LOC130688683 [Daphnia carinata]|uniref:uncharacterized protein LOC130688683 n=1 Tax=Daphnia carinata TaxID=120202 RepID=UPI00257F1055|nr:uncharacterized protein LOC130688683 [Daphnia carinata]